MQKAFAIFSILIVLQCAVPAGVDAAVQDFPSLDPLEHMLQAPFVTRDDRSIETICGDMGVQLPLSQPWALVEKSRFRLSLYDGETLVKSYPMSLGFNPIGDKVREGDGRTPEGEYYVCEKTVVPLLRQSALGTRWLRLSYPNDPHAQRGLSSKMLSQEQHDSIVQSLAHGLTPLQHTRLGGGIGIHGGSFDFDDGLMARMWTLGCIGLYDSDAEEIYQHLPVGSRVSILP